MKKILAVSVRPAEGASVVPREVAIPAIHPEGSNLAGPVSAEATVEFLIEPISRAGRAEERAFSYEDGPPGGQLPGPQSASFTLPTYPLSDTSPTGMVTTTKEEVCKPTKTEEEEEKLEASDFVDLPVPPSDLSLLTARRVQNMSSQVSVQAADEAWAETCRFNFDGLIDVIARRSMTFHERLEDLEDDGQAFSLAEQAE